jgi:hypothetical protein
MTSAQVILEFVASPEGAKLVRDALSVVVSVGDQLWLASDEITSLERLTRLDAGVRFGNHRSFALADILRLPNGSDQEIDIEGLDHKDGHLWLVGSHSLKRSNAKPGKNPVKQIQKLAEVERELNRYTLARIPLEKDDESAGLRLSSVGSAAVLARTESGSALTEVLVEDEHLGSFLAIPGKDNGFDVEGLAVADDRVFLGLRGPVLRGWAVILEFRPEPQGAELRLKQFGSEERRYHKHFLDLGGLGIRELCLSGSDLLILAGPTMDLDGPVRIFRWKGATELSEDSLVGKDGIELLFDVPYGQGTDHAEGMALFRETGSAGSLLVVYDAPSEDRKLGASAVKADVFDVS